MKKKKNVVTFIRSIHIDSVHAISTFYFRAAIVVFALPHDFLYFLHFSPSSINNDNSCQSNSTALSLILSNQSFLSIHLCIYFYISFVFFFFNLVVKCMCAFNVPSFRFNFSISIPVFSLWANALYLFSFEVNSIYLSTAIKISPEKWMCQNFDLSDKRWLCDRFAITRVHVKYFFFFIIVIDDICFFLFSLLLLFGCVFLSCHRRLFSFREIIPKFSLVCGW